MSDWTNEPLQDALDRMKRAHDRATGCHLTADMVQALGLTFLAETWSEERPKDSPLAQQDTRP